MFCVRCGNQIYPGQKFCPKCGYPVENHPDPPRKEMDFSLPAGIFVSALAAVLTPYIEYGGLQGCGNLSEDRVAYAFFVTKICMGIITAILAFLLAAGVVQSLMNTLI